MNLTIHYTAPTPPVRIYRDGHLLTYEQATVFAASLGWHLFDLADVIAPCNEQWQRGLAWEGTVEELVEKLKHSKNDNLQNQTA